MFPLSLALILVSVITLAMGLTEESPPLLILSVVLSIGAAATLVIAARQGSGARREAIAAVSKVKKSIDARMSSAEEFSQIVRGMQPENRVAEGSNGVEFTSMLVGLMVSQLNDMEKSGKRSQRLYFLAGLLFSVPIGLGVNIYTPDLAKLLPW